jgi:hypothetical protein
MESIGEKEMENPHYITDAITRRNAERMKEAEFYVAKAAAETVRHFGLRLVRNEKTGYHEVVNKKGDLLFVARSPETLVAFVTGIEYFGCYMVPTDEEEGSEKK